MQHTQGSSSRDEDASEINQLRVEVRQSKEEMCVFQPIILQFLPLEAKNIIHQQQQPHQQHDHVDDQQADDQHEHDDQQRHSPDDYFDYWLSNTKLLLTIDINILHCIFLLHLFLI